MILRAALVACAALLALLALQTWRLHTAQTRTAEALAAHATDRGAWAEASRAAIERTRQIESGWTAAHQETAHAARTAIVQAQTDAATARAAAGRLRDAARTVAARACPAADDPTAAPGSAAAASSCPLLADVLDLVERSGRAMAETATARGIAGDACVQSHDVLTAAGARHPAPIPH